MHILKETDGKINTFINVASYYIKKNSNLLFMVYERTDYLV